MNGHVLFVIAPWWRRPFRRDRAGRRDLLRYRLVQKPIGADFDQCEHLTYHWTRRSVSQGLRLIFALRRLAAPPTTQEPTPKDGT